MKYTILLGGLMSALVAFVAWGTAWDAQFQVRRYEANVTYYTSCQGADPLCAARLPEAQGGLDSYQKFVSVAEISSYTLGILAIFLVVAAGVLFISSELRFGERFSREVSRELSHERQNFWRKQV